MADHPPRVINVNFGPPSAGRIVAIVVGALVGVLLIAALWTSYYTVGAESEGVVLQFGKFFKTVEPGLHFKLPFGIDAVTVLPTRRQLKLEFGFSTAGYTNPAQVGQDPGEEKSMVTGDLNAALVEWVVQYRIEDPRQYLFDVRNPEGTLRDLSEAAMREVIGDRTVDELITIGRQDIEIEALARMQDLSKRYHLGIRVDQVQLKESDLKSLQALRKFFEPLQSMIPRGGFTAPNVEQLKGFPVHSVNYDGDKPTFVLTHRALRKVRNSVDFYSGDLARLVTGQLKPKFRNIWFVGGAALSAECLRLGLADEVRYSILPVVIGSGISFFGGLDRDVALHLVELKAYKSGAVELRYEVRK